jgi:hypothetical protein
MVSAVRGAAYDDLDLADVTREDLVKVLVTYRERPDRRFAANPGAAVRERSNAQHALSIWFYAITPLPFLCLRFLGILWHGPERLLAYRLSLSVGIPCFIVLCGVVLVMRSGRYEQERAPLYQGAHDGSQVR